tara:strand:- start:2006 stop:2275 length:270 start_codon:yes stop_codon:yes gene_type:complete
VPELERYKLKKKEKIMDSVIKYVTGFFGGLMSIMMALIPLSILWFVLTGGAIFNMDVVANLTALITSIGQGGFVGLVVLVLIVSFFTKK